MLCEECQKRTAQVHLTKIINNQKTEVHLCEECAQKRGDLGFMSNIQLNFPSLLSGFFDLDKHFQVGTSEPDDHHRCSCGLSFNNFRELGQLGCSSCYRTFGQELDPILRRIHGHTRHTGKVPQKHEGNLALQRQIEQLRQELKSVVAREEYEEAAKLRDQIKNLEQQLGGEHDG